MQACKELNITIIAYSPIEMGILTGKYTPTNLPPGVRRLRYNRAYVERIQPLIGLMREIGQTHGGKTPSQVALNWTICKGTLPIPGAKNMRQAQENIGGAGWRLTDDEVATLEKTSESLQR
jgi:aryl-alcohol dehydrogenase-like predicted oxidoreductase